jgi:hypothetical protein
MLLDGLGRSNSRFSSGSLFGRLGRIADGNDRRARFGVQTKFGSELVCVLDGEVRQVVLCRCRRLFVQPEELLDFAEFDRFTSTL